MFCTKCGFTIGEHDKFCSQCGLPTTAPPPLSRPLYDRKIAGVCAALSRHFLIDPTILRVLAIVLVFWPVPLLGAAAYLIAWIVMPSDAAALPPRRQTA